jgi:hypothetical protein
MNRSPPLLQRTTLLLRLKTKKTIHHGVTENTEESVTDLASNFTQY